MVDPIAPPVSLLLDRFRRRDLADVRAVDKTLEDFVGHEQNGAKFAHLQSPKDLDRLFLPPDSERGLKLLVHRCCVVRFDVAAIAKFCWLVGGHWAEVKQSEVLFVAEIAAEC